MTTIRLLTQFTLVAFFSAIVFSFLQFGRTEKPSARALASNSGAVVFTGNFERIDAGLELLADGTTNRLFISGANPNAGISPRRFYAQFGPRHPKLRELLDCCIEFGPAADTTLQNALETRCWLERRQISGLIVLVTSADHMPRALAALKRFVSDRPLVSFPVSHNESDSPEASRRRLHEYSKYVATLFLVTLPEIVPLSLGLYGPFERGCPAGRVTGSTLTRSRRASRTGVWGAPITPAYHLRESPRNTRQRYRSP